MINGKKFEDLTVKEIQTICDNSDECQGCPFNIGVGNCCCVFAYSPTEWVYEDKSIEWLKKIKEILPNAYEISNDGYEKAPVWFFDKGRRAIGSFYVFPNELKGIGCVKLDDLIKED